MALNKICSIERYELYAKLFYKKHGILAPGKDIAPGSGDTTTDEERSKKWHEFMRLDLVDYLTAEVLRLQELQNRDVVEYDSNKKM
jgi:hypothetical protein